MLGFLDFKKVKLEVQNTSSKDTSGYDLDRAKSIFQKKLSQYTSGYKAGWFAAICNQVTRFFSSEYDNLPPGQTGYKRAENLKIAASQCNSSGELIDLAKKQIRTGEGKATPKLLKQCVIEAAGFTDDRYAVQSAEEYNNRKRGTRASNVMLSYGRSPIGGDSYIEPKSLYAKERAINLIYDRIASSKNNGQSFLLQISNSSSSHAVPRVQELQPLASASYCCR